MGILLVLLTLKDIRPPVRTLAGLEWGESCGATAFPLALCAQHNKGILRKDQMNLIRRDINFTIRCTPPYKTGSGRIHRVGGLLEMTKEGTEFFHLFVGEVNEAQTKA